MNPVTDTHEASAEVNHAVEGGRAYFARFGQNAGESASRAWPAGCIDIETLGTAADAVILEIGCVLFDPVNGEMGPEYHAEVDMRASDQRLRGIESSTFCWWAERVKLGEDMPGMHGGKNLWAAMYGLRSFLGGRTIPKDGKNVPENPLTEDFQMWAWGSDFDFAILRNAFDDAQLELPWKFSNQCDARGVCKMLGVERVGPVRHMALEDARQEAEAVMEAMRRRDAYRKLEVVAFERGFLEEEEGDRVSPLRPLVSFAGGQVFYREGGAA